MKYFYLVLLLIVCTMSSSQEFTDSNLPIILIDTDIDAETGKPAVIQDEIRVFGTVNTCIRNSNYPTTP
ncbi:MAG: hypothetical protein H6584_01175 [Flavobacteriales bacterium]|nr:hypothetical protein [Flavobacteriales bacterium]